MCSSDLGHAEDMRSVYSMSDVIVLPSYREGMPRVVLEAASMALPVVTTDAVGCRDSIIPGQTGFLVPVRQSVELVDAIGRLIDDPALCRRMGEAGREFMRERFEVSKLIDSIVSDLATLAEAAV